MLVSGLGGFVSVTSIAECLPSANEQLRFPRKQREGKRSNESGQRVVLDLPVSHILSVAALDQDDNLASFSNFGQQSVHIAAPGVNILSTYPVAFGSYKFMSGTSMATPYVVGAAALIWNQVDDSSKPRWQAVRDTLIANSRHLDSLKSRVRGGTVFDLATMASGPGNTMPVPYAPSPSQPIPSSPLPMAPTKQKPVQSGGRSERFVYQQKVFNDHVLRGKGNLLSVELELKQPATVRITGHASVHSTNLVSVGTGYSAHEELTGEFWKESWRGLTVPADGQTVVLSSDFITQLAAGKHKIYWRVFTGSETDELLFSEAASLIVEIDQQPRAPLAETPAVKAPAAKAPAARTPPAQAPVVETPAPKAPAVEVPAGEEQVIKVPTMRLPSQKPSGAKSPPKKAPVVAVPAEVEIPGVPAE